VDYGSERIPPWNIAELDEKEAEEIKKDIFENSGETTKRDDRWSRPKRTEWEEVLRVPPLLAYKLRLRLGEGETQLSGRPDAYRFFNNYSAVDSFMESYYLLRKHMTTPFPFPMEQMNRTFLYFYIFTVPLTLLEDVKEKYPYLQMLVTVFLTYGFVGLQLIAVELDDPFGNDQVRFAF
jgi:putative membrane protein